MAFASLKSYLTKNLRAFTQKQRKPGKARHTDAARGVEALEHRLVPAISYGITQIGTLGGTSSEAYGLNDRGQVVGQSATASGAEHAFLYSGGAMTDLGTLGGDESYAYAINRLGQIVGYSDTASGATHAFLDVGGVMTDLGTLGGNYSNAFGINDLGQIVGGSTTAGGATHAFLYSAGTMTDLGTLGGDFSWAYGINNLGQIVGYSVTASGANHAFLDAGGVMTDLGTLHNGAGVAYAWDINNLGQVVGQSDPDGFLYSGGTMSDLGTLGGSGSFATSINDLGQIVGTANTRFGSLHPFEYTAGVMTDLTTLLPPGTPSILPYPGLTINNVGQIAATTSDNQALLLTPTNGNPTVVSPASATATTVTGTSVGLSVLGTDPLGEANLTYTWSSTGPAAVSFSANSTNTAKNTTAAFTQAGTYTFTATLRDPSNLTATSSVSVTVVQTQSGLSLAPDIESLDDGTTQQFTLSSTDQFGNAMPQSLPVTWTLNGPGNLSSSGLYTAPSTGTGTVFIEARIFRPGVGYISAGTDFDLTAATTGPAVVAPATATASTVTGTSVGLSVLGSDPGGESSLSYTWSSTGAGVTYSDNGTNAAKNSTATFTQAGTYTFTATLRDPNNLTATSSVSVTVVQTLSGLSLAPDISSLADGATQQFTASGKDQFGKAMPLSSPVTWTLGGPGTLSSSGLYTAPATGTGGVSVTARIFTGVSYISAGNFFTLTPATTGPTVITPATATAATVTGTTVGLSVRGSDPAGESSLTYTWSSTGPAGVTFSANGSNAAKNSNATFTQAGTYTFTATLKDPNNLTAISSVSVTVVQTLSGIRLAPDISTMVVGTTQQFTVSGKDQFGNAMPVSQPVTWTLGGPGTLSSSGLYTAPATGTGGVSVTARIFRPGVGYTSVGNFFTLTPAPGKRPVA